MGFTFNIKNLPARTCVFSILSCNLHNVVTATTLMKNKNEFFPSEKPKLIALQKALNISNSTAKICLNNNPILEKLNCNQIIKMGELMETYNIQTGMKGMSDCVHLFSMTPVIFKQCYNFLKSTCVPHIQTKHILKCKNLIEMRMGLYKAYTGIKEDVSIVDPWIGSLPKDLHLRTRHHLKKHASELFDPIKQSRNVIFASYLAWRLECSFKKAFELIESGVGSTPLSVDSFQETIDILFEIGFDHKKIMEHSAVLGAEPSNLRDLLRVSELRPDIETRLFILKHPYVCRIDIDVVQENLSNLLRFGFPKTVIMDNAKLICRPPIELLEKLEQVQEYPEMSVFYHNPKFMDLFDRLDTISIRLEALRAADRKNISLHLLSECNETGFIKTLQNGRKWRLPVEGVQFLCYHTGKTRNEIFSKLKVHPHKDTFTIENLKKVIDLLVKWNFSKLQIFNGVALVLYPPGRIAREIETLASRPEMQPFTAFRNNPQILQVILYYIEKKYHFTGRGVFDELPVDKPPIVTENQVF